MLKKYWLFLVVLSLLVLLVPACGGGEEEKTPAPTPTPAATLTPTATPTPTPAGPVKIGVITSWSGPAAMSGLLADQIIALVEEQLKQMGGVLGGREVKFVRGDDRGVVAESVAQAKKLILEDKVTALTFGGISAAQFTAVSNVAEELKTPYVPVAGVFGVPDKKYTICIFSREAIRARTADFIADVLKPKTVAWLSHDLEDSHVTLDGAEGVAGVRERLKAKGITIVSEQFVPQGMADLSPYLTRIKYLNPDLLISYLNDVGQTVTLNKQIMELGGWGSMKYFSTTETGGAKAATSIPAAVGTYVGAWWLPGSDDPGMKAFEDAFKQKYGRLPTPELSYYYNCIWTAIKAIELAGTDDRDKVAEAMRSGNLVWESAWGRLRIPTDGTAVVKGMVAQIQEGSKLVKVWPLGE